MDGDGGSEVDDKSGAKRDVSKTKPVAPAASGPHSPSVGSDKRDDRKARDNRKGGYGAG